MGLFLQVLLNCQESLARPSHGNGNIKHQEAHHLILLAVVISLHAQSKLPMMNGDTESNDDSSFYPTLFAESEAQTTARSQTAFTSKQSESKTKLQTIIYEEKRLFRLAAVILAVIIRL